MGQKYKLCALVCLAMIVLAMIPQIHLWIVRGRDWNGAYTSAFVDEPYYTAYVNALIDGRPRRNDPFGAKDDSPSSPLPESLYSVQFVPAYLIALPARWIGISATTAFIMLAPLAAFLASLAMFWLLVSITRDYSVAAAGTFFVLCLGGFFGSFGIFQQPVDVAFPVVPFLRRYQPAVSFPLYVAFCGLVWLALTSEHSRRARIAALLAGMVIALLIFSYFYLWTAAIAWLGCVGMLWVLFRPADWRRTISALAIIGVIAGITALPYGSLISHRAASTDEQQILVATRLPEPFHVHEIIALMMLLILGFAVFRGKVARTDPRLIYAASIGLLPFIVFNQQVITGRTLQSFHFEIYSVNYLVAIGIVITISLFWKEVPARLLTWLAALSFLWGIIAIGFPARAIGVELAAANDKGIPVLLRLKQLSSDDGTLTDLRKRGEASTLVYSPDVRFITLLPSWTSHGTLLDITGGDCAGVTRDERKRFFHMHLYYSKVQGESLRSALAGPLPPPPNPLLMVRSVVFGHARIYPSLSSQFVPVQPQEIDREVQNYQAYVNSFSREQVLKRPITYAVIPVEGNFDFTNLDRWYERDAGERVGDYVLYRLKLRP